MGVMFLLIILSFAIAHIQALVWIDSDWMVSTILPAVIVNLTNEERSDDSLEVLTRSDVLDAAAKLKAEDMAKNEYFAHYSPTGVSPWYWFDQVSYNFVHAGENLAVHFADSGDVVDAWMESPTHRANIMNGNFTEIGVGTAKGRYKGSSTVFVVQLFGTPNVTMSTPVASAKIPTVQPVQSSAILGETVTQKENIAREEDIPVGVEDVLMEASTTEAVFEEVPLMQSEEVNTTIDTPIRIESSDGVVVMYSDLATTSRDEEGGVLYTQDTNTNGTQPPLTLYEKIATQPSVWLQIVYAVLAVWVVISLLISLIVEWRRQHPMQMVYAGGLLAIMAFLLHMHTVLTGGVTIV